MLPTKRAVRSTPVAELTSCVVECQSHMHTLVRIHADRDHANLRLATVLAGSRADVPLSGHRLAPIRSSPRAQDEGDDMSDQRHRCQVIAGSVPLALDQ